MTDPQVGDRVRVEWMGHWYTGALVQVDPGDWYWIAVTNPGPDSPVWQVPRQRKALVQVGKGQWKQMARGWRGA